MAKKIVTFPMQGVVLVDAKTDAAALAKAKELVKEAFKGVPGLLVNISGEPPLLVTDKRQRKS